MAVTKAAGACAAGTPGLGLDLDAEGAVGPELRLLLDAADASLLPCLRRRKLLGKGPEQAPGGAASQ